MRLPTCCDQARYFFAGGARRLALGWVSVAFVLGGISSCSTPETGNVPDVRESENGVEAAAPDATGKVARDHDRPQAGDSPGGESLDGSGRSDSSDGSDRLQRLLEQTRLAKNARAGNAGSVTTDRSEDTRLDDTSWLEDLEDVARDASTDLEDSNAPEPPGSLAERLERAVERQAASDDGSDASASAAPPSASSPPPATPPSEGDPTGDLAQADPAPSTEKPPEPAPVLRSPPEAPSEPPLEGAAPKDDPSDTAAAAESTERSGAPPGENSEPPPPKPVERPTGIITVKEMHHKTADETVYFLRENFPEWLAKGHVAKIEGKGRSLMIFGETTAADDPLTVKISGVLDSFDVLELKIEERVIRPRYVDSHLVMDALVMRGLSNVWQRASEAVTATEQVTAKVTKTATYNRDVYAPTGLTLHATAPLATKPRVPYVYDLPISDPYKPPLTYGGDINAATTLIDFNQTSSTEQRGGFVAVGTAEDLATIETFVEALDKPAPRIMIEVQVVSLEANKLRDLGIDSAQFGRRHSIGGIALPLPGEEIIQPGFPADQRRNPDLFVPQLTQEGFQLIFDDTSIDLSGRFLTNLHALIREGEAKVKARPKILTLDDRVSVLHIGQEVPVFQSTGVTRDATDGNLISEVNKVTTQYVGITLNLRPKVTGGNEDEVSLLIEVVVNELGERARVFEEDLLGIPTVIKRSYVGQNRVRNHRPIILGGLILEEEVESINKIPILGDIPGLGFLFSRTLKSSARQEVILVLTPHILSDSGVDRVASPKESPIFDTFDSVLFNDRHIIKGRDVLGLDPITGEPASHDGRVFERREVVELTLLNIIRERRLVSKLRILDDYLGDASKGLSWLQRRWPERTVDRWSDEDQEVYFRAAAIVLENIRELNSDLDYDEIVTPRREIILPTTPYRISLRPDRVARLQELGSEYVLREGARVELSQLTIDLLRDSAGRSLAAFGDYLEDIERTAEEHGEVLMELKRFFLGQFPESAELEGASYPDVYRKLSDAGFDFFSLATYFKENMASRYIDRGLPDVGQLEADLIHFQQSAIGLYERAKHLRELHSKWSDLMRPPETATLGVNAGAAKGTGDGGAADAER